MSFVLSHHFHATLTPISGIFAREKSRIMIRRPIVKRPVAQSSHFVILDASSVANSHSKYLNPCMGLKQRTEQRTHETCETVLISTYDLKEMSDRAFNRWLGFQQRVYIDHRFLNAQASAV
eukprot:9939-Heterococcus_DN1.PRE.1